jgi:hypothetical protein
LGEPDATGRHHLVQQANRPGRPIALRVGPWKLIRQPPNTRSLKLVESPGERDNRITKHPEVA